MPKSPDPLSSFGRFPNQMSILLPSAHCLLQERRVTFDFFFDFGDGKDAQEVMDGLQNSESGRALMRNLIMRALVCFPYRSGPQHCSQ